MSKSPGRNSVEAITKLSSSTDCTQQSYNILAACFILQHRWKIYVSSRKYKTLFLTINAVGTFLSSLKLQELEQKIFCVFDLLQYETSMCELHIPWETSECGVIRPSVSNAWFTLPCDIQLEYLRCILYGLWTWELVFTVSSWPVWPDSLHGVCHWCITDDPGGTCLLCFLHQWPPSLAKCSIIL